MSKILLQNLNINYVEEGEKDPPVIFLHGAGGSYNLWLRQLEGLKKLRRVIALDLPGHGNSEGEGFESIDEYRDFLLEFLQAKNFERAILGGHSMGGAVALSLALAYPPKIEALVLVGTGAKLRVREEIFAVLRQDFDAAVKLISRAAYAPGFPQYLLALGESEMKKVNPRLFARDFRACNAFDVMAAVKNLTMPTLIICGEQDLFTPLKYSQYLEKEIPGARLSLIKEAGHMVMVEKPHHVNECMAEFIKSLG
jgi:pimeloyl-ACP methyl ester carboxylesterase